MRMETESKAGYDDAYAHEDEYLEEKDPTPRARRSSPKKTAGAASPSSSGKAAKAAKAAGAAAGAGAAGGQGGSGFLRMSRVPACLRCSCLCNLLTFLFVHIPLGQ